MEDHQKTINHVSSVDELQRRHERYLKFNFCGSESSSVLDWGWIKKSGILMVVGFINR